MIEPPSISPGRFRAAGLWRTACMITTGLLACPVAQAGVQEHDRLAQDGVREQQTTDDLASPRLLRPGDVVAGVIEPSDPQIRTDTLASDRYSRAVVRGREYQLEVPVSGPHYIELVSYFFDAYLVLRDESGAVLAEDDDGLLREHARLAVPEMQAGRTYRLDACALHDATGDFELRVVEGRPRSLSAAEHRNAEVVDARRRVEVVGAALGPDHPQNAVNWNYLQVLLYDRGDFEGARQAGERALSINEAAFGSEHVETGRSLNNLASVFLAQGNLARARQLYERALAVSEKAIGPEHPNTATTLYALGLVLMDLGDHEGARARMERALAIREAALGPGHPQVGQSLDALATLRKCQGDLEGARLLYERALAIEEATGARAGPGLTARLHNLGNLLRMLGDFERARPLLERALATSQEYFGSAHPYTAQAMDALATLLQQQGDEEGARSLFERALAICEASLGPEHRDTGKALNNLALVVQTQGDLPGARLLYERALEISKASLGPRHPETATAMNNLAALLQTQGDLVGAKPLYEGALEISESTLGPEHPGVARCLHNLAALLEAQGDLAGARRLHERALAIFEASLGREHPDTAQSLGSLAKIEFDLDRTADAAALSARQIEASEAQLRRLSWSLSESERLQYTMTQRTTLHLFLAIARRGLPDGERAAYETVLRWKGRVLRGLEQSRGRSLADLSALDQGRVESLRQLQRSLSRALFQKEIVNREVHEELLGRMRVERQELERALSRSLGAAPDEGVSVSAVAAALSADTVLVDFLVHPDYHPVRRDDEGVLEGGHWTKPRLSAWIVRADGGGTTRWIDLGDAAPIEAATKRFLETLLVSRGISTAGNDRAASTHANDTLRALLWDPLRAHLGDAKQVLASPDSFLGSLPLEVLQEVDGSFLIERFAFVYLQDAASLSRVRAAGLARSLEPETVTAQSSLLCVGDVDYRNRADLAFVAEGGPTQEGTAGNGSVASVASPSLASSSWRGGFRTRWSPLPATREEVLGIVDLHEEAFPQGHRVLHDSGDATEECIKAELPHYRSVHLATHGFFQPEGLPSMWEQVEDDRGLIEMAMREEERRLTGLLPGFLSGLVLAGANRDQTDPGRDDGYLTAEELSFLDLSEVDLVVLSACESGLGRPQGGEGMLGFRRTLRAAGARTVISSLWRVSDDATSALMVEFYERLWLDGHSKLDALRGAQLDMLRRNRIEHQGDARPSTWGAFVLDGAWE